MIFSRIASLFLCLSMTIILGGSLSCSNYSLGGTKPDAIKHIHTIYIEIFKNNSLYPRAEVLLTSSISQNLASNGTFEQAPKDKADAILRGTIANVNLQQVRSQWYDTYKSMETALLLTASYELVDVKSGKILRRGTIKETANYFNQGDGQVDRWNAYSYAARKTAERIVISVAN